MHMNGPYKKVAQIKTQPIQHFSLQSLTSASTIIVQQMLKRQEPIGKIKRRPRNKEPAIYVSYFHHLYETIKIPKLLQNTLR